MSQETDHTNDLGEPDKTAPKGHPLENLPVISGDSPNALPPLPGENAEEDEETRNAMASLLAHRKKRRRRNIVIGIVAACAVLAVLVWTVTSQQSANTPEGPTLQTTPVMHGEFTDQVKASGNVQPVSSVVVTPEVDGIISEVFVSEGDYVEAGTTLLTIRNDSLDKAVREADIQLRSAKTQLSSAKENYNTAYKAYYADQTDLATVNSAADDGHGTGLGHDRGHERRRGRGSGLRGRRWRGSHGLLWRIRRAHHHRRPLADDSIGAGERDGHLKGLRWAGGARDLLGASQRRA